jgi:hypothetical protein
LSEPLAAHVPELAPQVHSGVEPLGYPDPAESGQLLALMDRPLVYVTPKPPEPILEM